MITMRFSQIFGMVIFLLPEGLESSQDETNITSEVNEHLEINSSLTNSSISNSFHPSSGKLTPPTCPVSSFYDVSIRRNNLFNTSLFRPFNESNLFHKSPEKVFKCIPINQDLTEGPHEVGLLNNSQLLQQLSRDGNPRKKNHCTVVLFYAPWCPFSIRMTPHYHALARNFPQLDVVAVDAYNFSHLSSRFGAISVPTMIVFHDDKAFSKFNASQWDIEHFIHFLNNVTGFSVNSCVEVQKMDFQGPLPTTLSKETDYYLWMAWTLIIACAIYAVRFYLRYIHIVTSFFDFTNYRATHHHID